MLRLNSLLERKLLVENFFSLSIINAVNVLLPMLTLPYLLRVVGASNYGIYAYTYVLIQYILLFSSYGFNLSGVKQISQSDNKSDVINRLFTSILISRLLLFLIGTIIVILLMPFLLETSEKKFIFFTGIGIVLGDIFSCTWLFQGLQKMRFTTITNTLSKVVFTTLIFIVVKKAEDFKFILFVSSVGALLAGIVSLFFAYLKCGVKYVSISVSDIKFQFKEGFALFGSTIGTSLYTNANIFLLNFFVSPTALGVYAVAEKINKAFQTMTSPITQTLFPFVGSRFVSMKIEERMQFVFKIAKTMAWILLIPNIIIFLLADFWVTLFSGAGFNGATTILRILCPTFFVGGLNFLFGVIALINLNKQVAFFKGVMISGILNVLLIVSLAPILGIVAAAWSCLVSEIVLLMICYRSLVKMSSVYEKRF